MSWRIAAVGYQPPPGPSVPVACSLAGHGRLAQLWLYLCSAWNQRQRSQPRAVTPLSGWRSRPTPFRVYSPSYSLPQTAASSAALEQIDGVEPVHLTGYDRFMAQAGGYGEGPFSVTIPPFPDDASLEQTHSDAQPNLQLLGLLNGQFLAAAFPLNQAGLSLQWQDPGTWLYENEFALPRAFVVHQTEPVTNDQAWERLDCFDPARIALVEGGHRLSGRRRTIPRLDRAEVAESPRCRDRTGCRRAAGTE